MSGMSALGMTQRTYRNQYTTSDGRWSLIGMTNAGIQASTSDAA